MNVVARCQKHLKTKEAWNEFYAAWTLVVNSTTLQQYQEYLLAFEKLHPTAVEYCKKTWLVWKEKLIQQNPGFLQLSDINNHWHYERKTDPQSICQQIQLLDPLPVVKRKGSKNKGNFAPEEILAFSNPEPLPALQLVPNMTSTTQLAILRGAGSTEDLYDSGNLPERAYIQSLYPNS
ncbi:hypothetical protein GcM3_008054 [Golovinomyces cichoracearum]|uniref:Uncharacterized protein n=1 Tax=Golovinomyces cichoracearum TaxID=62708 RepID=A0A420JAG5_9PEZI|nr:hypothetical protein GcM3_008054 [Golovinomyces cichoracearum]